MILSIVQSLVVYFNATRMYAFVLQKIVVCGLISVLLHRFWHESTALWDIKGWFNQDEDVVSVDPVNSDGSSNITVKCGDQTCKFELKTYCIGDKLRISKDTVASVTEV